MNVDRARGDCSCVNPIDPLGHTELEALKRVCEDLGLSDEMFKQIEYPAQLLRGFERISKPNLRTPRSRVKTLKKVEKLAAELHKAIEQLHMLDQRQLWQRMPPDGIRCGKIHDLSRGQFRVSMRIAEDGYEAMYPHFPGRVGHIGAELERLAQSAHEEILAIGDEGIDGGRKTTLSTYAFYIGEIWAIVQHSHIKLGRGGDFERLCDAVFKAACVPSNAEGTVREFVNTVFPSWHPLPNWIKPGTKTLEFSIRSDAS